jgi:uncharacterized protein YndB with AHSA1/START domain
MGSTQQPQGFVPDRFEVPRELVTDQFRLEPLGPQHNAADHEAWTSSIEHIRATPGFPVGAWPRPDLTLEENLADLRRHADDFARRAGFTYTVLEPGSGRVVGCVYVYPSRETAGVTDVRSWVRADRAELDVVLHDAVAAWLASDWPFETVSYAPRTRVVSATREIAAAADVVFELIADPSQQPRWDGNDNLAEAPAGQRVHGTGEVFTMTLTGGAVRENHVVEFAEGRLIAWRPSPPGGEPPGHLWRWELEPVDASRTRVTHTYDWSELTDESRIPTARATTSEKLQASLSRLAALVEHDS